jgi:hypothetical protein
MLPNAGDRKPAGSAEEGPPSRKVAFLVALAPSGDDFVIRAWTGRERLWKVYWIYGALASVGLVFVLRMLLAVGMPQFLMFAIVAPYQVWLVVSAWRCAFNADWRGWGYIARFLTVAGVAVTILGLAAVTTLGA